MGYEQMPAFVKRMVGGLPGAAADFGTRPGST